MSPNESGPVAIVGMAVLLPGAPDLDTYWHNLANGVDAVTEVPAGRWDQVFFAPEAVDRPDRVYCRRGGFVDAFAEVDVTRFGIMPNSVPATEPDQLIALHVADQAISDAGGQGWLPADRQRVGVILGRGGYLTPGLVQLDQRVRTANQVVRTLGELFPELGADRLEQVRAAFTAQLGPAAPESAIGLVPNLAASRVANRLDLRGPAYTVDAACASSLVAVDHAVRELGSGRCDVVLAGGVHHCHDITLWSVFAQLRALSPGGSIRPFHRDADGILIGEGTAVVVLKRLADAQRDGDRVYAVLRGTGVASDGRTASLMNPDSGGQALAVRQAWRAAGLDPRRPGSIGLLEAHGTATPAGDAAELATLAEVFGPASGDRPVIGSVKSMIGHTMPAAGAASLVKAALAVYHGILPPTLHCDRPHPGLAATRFRTVATAEPWPAALVRRAGVNAFGFGGINAHVVLEQAPESAAPRHLTVVREPERILRLAAESPQALAELLDAPDSEVLDEPGSGPARLGIVDLNPKRLALARRVVAAGQPWGGGRGVWFAPTPVLGADGGKLAFVFPGLEAQFEPRAADVAARFGLGPVPSTSDVRVGDIGRHGTAVFQLGRLLDAALRRMGIVPDAVAGHSVGEWTAMACGGIYAEAEVDNFLGAFDPDSVRVPGLAFAAIGASADRVREVLAAHPKVVLSHDNAPNQSVVCGPATAVSELLRRFRGEHVLGSLLPFQSGFHTPMLRPYLDPIEKAADSFTLRPPTVPVWSATTAAEYPDSAAEVRRLFVRHVLEPVAFRPMIEAMYRRGFRAFLQVGVGQVGSLVDDILADRPRVVVSASSAHYDGCAQLLRVAIALWTHGATPDLTLLQTKRIRAGKAVRLKLGGPLVSLDARTRAVVAGRTNGASSELSVLDSMASGFPFAAELSALLRETASSAAEVLSANRRAAVTREPDRIAALPVSIKTMPYLLDHCFFRQRAGWPDPVDRWPVVPATTVIAHLMAVAEQTMPGHEAVAVHDVRLNRWITAIPSVEIPITAERTAPDRIAVSLGQYARAMVVLAPRYPAPPAPWRWDQGAEREPEITAAQLYTDRWMFHGPQFQGVTRLTAIGDGHVRGVLTTPPAPGALLDNVGQLLGYWIMSTQRDRTVVFPVHLRQLRFFGRHPRPGEQLECLVRITSLTAGTLEADMQLVRDGTVWAELTGWQDRRFDSNPELRAVDRFPERTTLSRQQPGGWSLLHERWPDLASRELIMRNHFGRQEREGYEDQAPPQRRQWLLGRIAVKDSVRQWLWDHGHGELFPAEVVVRDRQDGGVEVTGLHGSELPDLTVAVAHRAEIAVAITRAGSAPAGIAIEELGGRSAEAVRTRAATSAVAAAGGCGPFTLHNGQSNDVTVRGRDREYLVHCRRISNPPELPARDYLVAWTTHQEQERTP